MACVCCAWCVLCVCCVCVVCALCVCYVCWVCVVRGVRVVRGVCGVCVLGVMRALGVCACVCVLCANSSGGHLDVMGSPCCCTSGQVWCSTVSLSTSMMLPSLSSGGAFTQKTTNGLFQTHARTPIASAPTYWPCFRCAQFAVPHAAWE